MPFQDVIQKHYTAAEKTSYDSLMNQLEALAKSMTETRRLHDYDNHQNALIDYKYTQYKNETAPGTGFDSKAAELKQFFPATGGGNPPTPPATP